MAPEGTTNYASECARLAELTDNQSLRDDLVALALDWMAEAERDDYSNVIAFPWRGQRWVDARATRVGPRRSRIATILASCRSVITPSSQRIYRDLEVSDLGQQIDKAGAAAVPQLDAVDEMSSGHRHLNLAVCRPWGDWAA